MRFAMILALAALPLATTAQAGGIPGMTLPHLSWPDEAAPETPTRDCSPGTVISGDVVTSCPTVTELE